ncbi:MAG TPA: NAD+ synthase [Caulobacteraceae bacterium]|nr:NAD+ synthase [Caulobacteraceae bacterium]
MTERLTIAAVQANPTVGAIDANADLAAQRLEEATAAGADLALFSELFLIGYPPEDLALKPAAVAACQAALNRLAPKTKGGAAALIGLPWPSGAGAGPHNACALVADGEVRDVTFKVDLPNYGVFDEKRVFTPGPGAKAFDFKGFRIGVPVCEDVWGPIPCRALMQQGAELLLVPNGSPYRRTAKDERMAIARERTAEAGVPLVYVNQVGGQDELVFDGGSFALQADGNPCMQLPMFADALGISRWEKAGGTWICVEAPMSPWLSEPEAIYRAMALGLRDYENKSGFPSVIIGLSGGIDSALTAVVAADALGPERVSLVMLPSRYTSKESLEDARACAEALGAPYRIIPIEPAVGAFDAMLAEAFAGRNADVTEENIQARTRGVVLMALSNKTGALLLTTGNKSEMAVGYATLYGDMSGGYNILKDIYKTDVFAVARWRNANRPVAGAAAHPIPERILTKPPSAELRPNQTDQDSLPPYAELDGILQGLVEEEATLDEIVARGYAPATVERIQRLLYASEYKRRQAPPGVKIGGKAFGRDRRYPLVNAFRDRIGGFRDG